MRQRLSILLLTAMMPVAALAEPVPVLSGEHTTFTRLVTPINGSAWTATQEGRSVRLTFADYDGGFDTSGIYDLIPRDRIRSVRADSDELTLLLACDCVISVTTERDLYVVLDVAENESALDTPQFMIDAAPARTDVPIPEEVPVRPPSIRRKIHASARPLGWDPEVVPEAHPEIISALQNRLISELETATRRGVLSPATKNTFSLTPALQSSIVTEAFDTEAPIPTSGTEPSTPVELSPQDLSNLRISTSRDIPDTFRDLAEITSSRGQVCPPDAALNVSAWGDDRPFVVQITKARQGLYGDFDRVNTDVAFRLAKTYLYFGFGAEARDVLEIDETLIKKAPYLVTLSLIMDGHDVPAQNALAGLAECQGETALWATLVAPIPARGALPKSDGAMRTLNSLPSHLRLLLVPKLHEILLAYGDPDGAEATLRAIKRLPGDLPAAAKLAEANGKLEAGQTENATHQLAEVVEENDATSPTALIALVDAKLKAEQPISAETARLVEAYVQELRTSELGPELQRVHILSLAQSGQFDAAFAMLNAQPDSTEGLRQKALTRLTTNANDIVFLDHALVQKDRDIAALSPKDVLALAERFLELGFPTDAERVMGVLPFPHRQRDQQLLAARVSLAMGKPFRAQADLLELQGETANRLRADAMRMSGAHGEAHVLYDQINHTQDATETAWLAENWRTLTTQETPTFGPATALPNSPEPTTGAVGMLARTATLLDQSTQTRETLQNLLNAENLQISDETE